MRHGIVAAALVLAAFSDARPCVAQPASTPGPLASVAKLYQEFAAEAVIDSPELVPLDLFGRPKAAMARYLDDSLVSLVLADRACAERTGEICHLDFSPIWDAQDAVGATVKLSSAKDPSRVAAEISFPDKTVSRLTYVMVKTAAGWRILRGRRGRPPARWRTP